MTVDMLNKAYNRLFDMLEATDAMDDRFEAEGNMKTITDALEYISQQASAIDRFEVLRSVLNSRYDEDDPRLLLELAFEKAAVKKATLPHVPFGPPPLPAPKR